MSAQSPDQKKSQPIPGFKLMAKLGQGGMGAVYRAKQESLDREVAVKIMPLDLAKNPEFKERFFREARAAGRLNHPNIVQGIDAGEAGGKYCWIAMEFVDGESVASKLKREGRLSETEAIQIGVQIARALQHAAQADIVHRDVKPENFLLTAAGISKLCDLGIAKAPSDAGLTQEGRAVGTPRYISPEQARGEHDVDLRSDIYSLGASLYHMVAGEPPFEGPTAAVVMTKHITETAPPLAARTPGVNPHLSKVVEKMMAKNREERYQTFEELLEDLDALAAGQAPKGVSRLGPKRNRPVARKQSPSIQTGTATNVRRGTRATEKKDPVLLWGGIAGGAVLLAVLIFWFTRDTAPPPPPPPPPPVFEEEPRGSVSRPRNETTPTVKPVLKPDARKTPVPKPPAAETNPESVARRGWESLQKLLNDKPDMFHADLYRKYAEENPDSPYAQKAREEAKRLDEEIDAASRELMATRARQAWEKLLREAENLSPKEQISSFDDFARAFPNSEWERRARKAIRRIREDAGMKGEEVHLDPAYPETALPQLEAIAAGEAQATPEAIRPFLTHAKSNVRATALQALWKSNIDQGSTAALAAIKDRNAHVRRAAIALLADQKDVPAVRVALQATSEQDVSQEVRAAAAAALE